jgi:hypothetical protein
MLVSSSSPSATTQKYSTTPAFSRGYPPIPGACVSPRRGLTEVVSYTETNRHIVATYDGSVLGSIQILPGDISGRALSLAIPKGGMTAAQQAVIQAARLRAQAFGVNLTITEF